ncbi:glycoside hydrolase [Streptomyces sp. 8K308]|uniref:C40 family peptidase n=1 Tax=Streptomyces sp. 8K308 TaxID=2530388 RepID=UPI0010476FF9|nr:C40 family peptidase [Streptomyces sp. 8K308]TDC26733.1 glycoside hydrolase [Streptomyces sp. 8K308]
MGSHRKPRGRTALLESPAGRRGVVGVGAAALASMTLLSRAASADDGSIEEQRERAEAAHERAVEVRAEVDRLYREAGTATQHYNEAQEAVEAQQETVDGLLTEAAQAAERVNEARRTLGSFAAAQYRTGGGGAVSDTAALLLSTDPRAFFDRTHTLDRLGDAQRQALADFTERQEAATAQGEEAGAALAALEERQAELQRQQESVQSMLAEARAMLDDLSAEEQAELDELERLEREEAERQAAEAERRRQERLAAERAAAEEAAAEAEAAEESVEAPSAPAPDASGAEAAIAFAESQLGKPYVWGATGPNSYDCSGLTQAAWRAAGVELPRVTWDQVDAGSRVSRDALRPGDLVFFYDDISHVGLYVGDGMMIHAPKPGAVVRYESIDTMPFYAGVRPS